MKAVSFTMFVGAALSGCFLTAPEPTPVAPQVYVPPSAGPGGLASGPDDATLLAEAAAAAGGSDVSGTVTGLAMATGFSFEASARTCYDLAVAANDAADMSLLVSGNERSIYPNESGNLAQGRVVTYTHCADDAGAIVLRLSAGQAWRPTSSPTDEARFAVAGKARPETPAERAARHRVERARFENAGRDRCDAMTPSSAYSCMQQLEADLDARDARAARP